VSILSIFNHNVEKGISENPRALLLLIEALALHAVNIDAASKTDFQSEIRELAFKLEAAATPDERLILTGQVVQTVQVFARNTEQYAQAQRREIQSMVDCLATTLVHVSKSSGQSATNLREIERRLVAVTLLDDIRELRAELKRTVTAIQEESTRHEREYEVFREKAGSARSGQTVSRMDDVTGLPSAREAEIAIEAIAGSEGIFPVVFVLERLDMINSRYGFKAGDQILMLFSQMLAQDLKPEDRLYRWRGPSFVALLSRNASIDSVRSELKRFSSTKLEKMLDVDNRKVLMRISSVCALISVMPNGQPRDIVPRIDAFIASQTARIPT
jgi:GGDEF domain-containing protein